MKTVISVENIKCGGCINSIKNGLMKIDGVQEVTIDLGQEAVTIDSSDALDRTLLVATLAKMGYPESGNNSALLKVKSYVSCAIGRMNEEITR